MDSSVFVRVLQDDNLASAVGKFLPKEMKTLRQKVFCYFEDQFIRAIRFRTAGCALR